MADPNWTPREIMRGSLRGGLALGLRQVVAQALNVTGGVLLANLLTTAEFGAYGIVLFVLGFFTAFADAGLGASLIRQPKDPEERDYRAVFTVQQLLILILVLAAIGLAPWLSRSLELDENFSVLVRFVAFGIMATSFQVIPSIRLERDLRFDRLAAVEIGQAVVFNGLAVGLAWAGHGVLALGYALVGRALIGALLANLVSPWRPAWTWDWPRVRHHLSFGLPYQGVTFISLFKDSLTPVYIGALLGASAVGAVHWAQMVATYPVIALFMMQRLFLPAFARMQAHPAELAGFVDGAIYTTHVIAVPLSVLVYVLIEPITVLVFGEKWLEFIPIFRMLWMANFLMPTIVPVLGLVNAIGRPKLAFGFSVLWMFASWGLAVPALGLWGVTGYGIANVALQPFMFAIIPVAATLVPFKAWRAALPVWVLGVLMGVSVFVVQLVAPVASIMGLALYVLGGLGAFYGTLAILHADRLRTVLGIIRREAVEVEATA